MNGLIVHSVLAGAGYGVCALYRCSVRVCISALVDADGRAVCPVRERNDLPTYVCMYLHA